MSISIEVIEDAIFNRLRPLETLPKFEVRKMPETQAEMDKPFVNGRVTVMYDGSRFEPNGSGMQLVTMATDESVQQETLHIKTTLQARKLRGEFGIYDLMRLVRNHLSGFEPAGGDKMKQIDAKFESYIENEWTYSITWGTNVLNVHDLEETDDPTITQIDFDDIYGN